MAHDRLTLKTHAEAFAQRRTQQLNADDDDDDPLVVFKGATFVFSHVQDKSSLHIKTDPNK